MALTSSGQVLKQALMTNELSSFSLLAKPQGAEDVNSIKSGYQLGGPEQTYSWSQ